MSGALPLLALALLAATPDQPAHPEQARGEPVMVEPRLLVKKHRLFFGAGGTVLARGDYYNNPGVTGAVTVYPIESGGVELRFAWFFSSLNSAGREVFRRTRLVPDAHRPIALVMAGWRQSLGYGKVLAGSSLGVLHFDFQVAAHGGAVVTDRAVTPAAAIGPALLMRFTDHFFGSLEVAGIASWEKRSESSFALGVLPILSIGGAL